MYWWALLAATDSHFTANALDVMKIIMEGGACGDLLADHNDGLPMSTRMERQKYFDSACQELPSFSDFRNVCYPCGIDLVY